MTLAFNLQPPQAKTSSLERAILETLAYSDIFEYPLRLDELHRYLPVRAEMGKLPGALASLNGRVGKKDDFYFLAGREEIVEIRRDREARSKKLQPLALKYGRLLGSLPFTRMVALTGSLAVMNVSKETDFDYLLVTAKGRVWTVRAFALLLNRFARLFGHTLCPNLILSESALEWRRRDLYSARELYQMIPITGRDVYRRLMEANQWAEKFLPNALAESGGGAVTPWRRLPSKSPARKNLIELSLRGRLGGRLEAWEMNRKIARFSKQEGFGEETVFTAEVCQGNFHHHRRQTRKAFEQRLHDLGFSSPLSPWKRDQG